MPNDEIDTALLTLLAENARMPVATMARRMGLARTTVQARLDKLESNGTIAGYTLRLGTMMRPRLRATVLLSVEPHVNAAILSRLKTQSQVETVHTASGRFDLIVNLAADTTEELDTVLDRICDAQGVRSSESLIHLSTKIDRST
ncbi:Lrp/AsnC family transcriptional regulator [Thalassovita sp.]|uniref:Lrp/AsnC family transcriptional regulator n=1 Tax=Thalassovita sp. TaxID=1979401 RepID=UPI00288182A8|nr:Lrp/AsnC family transcriptional regulator [Thalassovita sp.]MDF1803083.1 Lrp/AsnC family transcriptional regulator [Thalassovita sp.]